MEFKEKLLYLRKLKKYEKYLPRFSENMKEFRKNYSPILCYVTYLLEFRKNCSPTLCYVTYLLSI